MRQFLSFIIVIFLSSFAYGQTFNIPQKLGELKIVAGSKISDHPVEDGQHALATNFTYISDTAIDDDGNLIIADYLGHRIRKIEAETGIITTIAGNGDKTFTPGGGDGKSISIGYPTCVSAGKDGAVYFAGQAKDQDAIFNYAGKISNNGTVTYLWVQPSDAVWTGLFDRYYLIYQIEYSSVSNSLYFLETSCIDLWIPDFLTEQRAMFDTKMFQYNTITKTKTELAPPRKSPRFSDLTSDKQQNLYLLDHDFLIGKIYKISPISNTIVDSIITNPHISNITNNIVEKMVVSNDGELYFTTSGSDIGKFIENTSPDGSKTRTWKEIYNVYNNDFVLHHTSTSSVLHHTFTIDKNNNLLFTIVEDRDRKDAIYRYTLSTQISPEISLQKSEIDFEGVELGDSRTLSLRISNSGNIPLTIGSISSNSNEVTLSESTLQIPVGEEKTIDLTYLPTSDQALNNTVTFISNDIVSYNKELIIKGTPLVPKIVLQTEYIDFGAVMKDSSVSIPLIIKNEGTGTLALFAFDMTTGLFVSPTDTMTIPSNQSKEISVTFTPSTLGERTGRLTITNNDPKQSSVDINLSGKGATPIFKASAQSLEFGEVAVETSDSLTVKFRNDGNFNLEISNIRSQRSAFIPAAQNLTIEPGAEKELSVRFSPFEASAIESSLLLNTNDPEALNVILELKGTGILTPVMTVSSEEVNFGEILVGASITKEIEIRNEGKADLIINDFNLDKDNPFFTITGVDTPAVIGLDKTTTFFLTFTPKLEGHYPTTLTIPNNDIRYESQSFVMNVSGVGRLTDILMDLNGDDGNQNKLLKKGIKAGDEIGVEIYVANLPDITAFKATLSYDSAQLAYGSFNAGKVLPDILPLAIPKENAIELNIAATGGSSSTAETGLLGTAKFVVQPGFADSTDITMDAIAFSISGVLQTLSPALSVKLSSEPDLLGDFDGDGSVGFADFILFAQSFGQTVDNPGYNPSYDLDGDDSIGFSDFVTFAQNFGKSVA